MNFFSQFLEPIEVCGKPIGSKYRAYKMDSSEQGKDMRKAAGVGTCHCCDYFLPHAGMTVLIEETRLLDRVKNIRKEYHYLEDSHKDDIVNKLLSQRMQLKAYGAMLVLCRLVSNFPEEKGFVWGKKHQFWVLASKVDTEDEKRFFDNMRDSLLQKIKEVLGEELIDDVNVFSVEDFKRKIMEK